jgi:hypothetical protein
MIKVTGINLKRIFMNTPRPISLMVFALSAQGNYIRRLKQMTSDQHSPYYKRSKLLSPEVMI